MEKKSESLYPVGPDDALRVCAWFEEKWITPYGATKKVVKRRECYQRFQQWNQQQNQDPWALCWKHAYDDGQARRRGKSSSSDTGR